MGAAPLPLSFRCPALLLPPLPCCAALPCRAPCPLPQLLPLLSRPQLFPSASCWPPALLRLGRVASLLGLPAVPRSALASIPCCQGSSPNLFSQLPAQSCCRARPALPCAHRLLQRLEEAHSAAQPQQGEQQQQQQQLGAAPAGAAAVAAAEGAEGVAAGVAAPAWQQLFQRAWRPATGEQPLQRASYRSQVDGRQPILAHLGAGLSTSCAGFTPAQPLCMICLPSLPSAYATPMPQAPPPPQAAAARRTCWRKSPQRWLRGHMLTGARPMASPRARGRTCPWNTLPCWPPPQRTWACCPACCTR